MDTAAPQLIDSFATKPLAAIAGVLALAVFWLYRDLAKMQGQVVQIATQNAGMAEKLAEGVRALERLLDKYSSKESDK